MHPLRALYKLYVALATYNIQPCVLAVGLLSHPQEALYFFNAYGDSWLAEVERWADDLTIFTSASQRKPYIIYKYNAFCE